MQTFVLAFVLLLSVSSYAQTLPAEPTLFPEGGEMFHHGTLSQGVLAALIARPETGWLRDTKPKDPSQYFQSVPVHLCGAKESDLILFGEFPLSGADHGWFWIVRSVERHPYVALYAGENSLRVLPKRTNGCLGIQGDWESPNERITRYFAMKERRYSLVKHADVLLH